MYAWFFLGFFWKNVVLVILRILETHKERHQLHERVELFWCLPRGIEVAKDWTFYHTERFMRYHLFTSGEIISGMLHRSSLRPGLHTFPGFHVNR
jgi:hypothetical protein